MPPAVAETCGRLGVGEGIATGGRGAAALGGTSCSAVSRSGTLSTGRSQYSSRRSASLATVWSGDPFSRPNTSELSGSA